jgi:DNA uptake protein ComE-like DNA-binding protein
MVTHINREIPATPRTLTNLLKGISYSASQLPAIRSIIESQQGVRAKTKGKRTLYLKKKMLAATAKTKRAKVKTAPADTDAKSAVVEEAPAASSSTTTSA